MGFIKYKEVGSASKELEKTGKWEVTVVTELPEEKRQDAKFKIAALELAKQQMINRIDLEIKEITRGN